MYTLECPSCGEQREYTSKAGIQQAKRNESVCYKCSAFKKANRASELKNFQNRNLKFYYWLGFILADGHISNNRLTVTLSKKDKNHLIKLSKYLGGINNRLSSKNQPTLSIMNKKVIKKLVKDFDIKSNKTEQPPSIKPYEKLKYNELKCLLIGIIDGDGTVKKQWKREGSLISIKVHKNWKIFLTFLQETLNFGSEPYINKDGYCVYNISSHIQCLALKKYTQWKNLPVLKRKWKRIKKVQLATSPYLKLRIFVRLNQNIQQKKIAEEFNIEPSYISNLKKRYPQWIK